MRRPPGLSRRTHRARWLGALWGVLALGLAVHACGDGPTGPVEPPAPDPPQPEAASEPSAEPVAPVDPAGVCGDPTAVELVASRGGVFGSVTVSNDEGELTVVYRTSGDWELVETHLAVTSSVEDVPTTASGLPAIGKFPERALHDAGTTAHAVTLPLAELDADEGEDLIVAAHADVIVSGEPVGSSEDLLGAARDDRTALDDETSALDDDPADPGDDLLEGAWGDGTPFVERGRGNTGTYFVHAVQGCTSVAQTVGPEGGTVEAGGADPGEGVQLVIPAGALAEPVEITIEPVPLSKVAGVASGEDPKDGAELSTVEASSYTTDDLVEGTAYDFGPDGLEFLEPVEIVLGYDDASLGPDPEVVEELLHVFIVNGIFEPVVPSTVDAAANEVSAFVDHFTVFAAGVVEEAPAVEVSITEEISVADEVSVRGPAGGTIAEEVSVTDQVSVTVDRPVSVPITETVSVTDQVDVTVTGPVRVSVREDITVADDVGFDVAGPVDVSVRESITVADEVALSVDPASTGPFAYVGAQGDDSVTVVDRSTRAVAAKIPVGNPFALATRPGGAEVYVGRGGDGAVAVVDVATNTVVATITGFRGTIDMEFRPDGNTAYVSSGSSTSVLYVVDATRRTVSATVGGLAPFSRGMAITPGGDSALVVADDTVTVVDLTTNTVIDKLAGSFTGGDAAVTPDGTTLVVTDLLGAELEFLDLTTGTLTASVPVGARPSGVAMDPTGSTAYTANENGNSVSPVDLATLTTGTAIPVTSQPYRIALTEDGGSAWVSQRSGDSVALLDLTTGAVITSIAVGSFPSDVALTP